MVATEREIPSLGASFYLFVKLAVLTLPFSDFSLLTCFVVSDRPVLEELYQGRVQAALEFSLTIDDFDDLVDPRHLYECCLGLESSAFVLKKIAHEEKSRFILPFFLISSFFIGSYLSNFLSCRNGY